MNIITAHRTYKTPATAKRALEKVVSDFQLNFEDVRWMIAVDNTGTRFVPTVLLSQPRLPHTPITAFAFRGIMVVG